MENVCCSYCHQPNELRPYGKNGEWVCFKCAMSTPERKRETELQFASQLDACGHVAVVDGTNVGPYPVEHAADAFLAALDGKETK